MNNTRAKEMLSETKILKMEGNIKDKEYDIEERLKEISLRRGSIPMPVGVSGIIAGAVMILMKFKRGCK